jgi:hypothetical protein
VNGASRHPQLSRHVFDLKLEPVARDDSYGRINNVINIDAGSFATLPLWRLTLVLDAFFSFVIAGTNQRPMALGWMMELSSSRVVRGHREDLLNKVPRVYESFAR